MNNFKVSDPSTPFTFINVPEITSLTSQFVYRYYTYDERLNDANNIDGVNIESINLNRLPRYVTVKWERPTVSAFNGRMGYDAKPGLSRIRNNIEKIISENDAINVNMLSHFFSDISTIEVGSTELLKFVQLNEITPNESEESFSNILKHISETATKTNSSKKVREKVAAYAEGFSKLVDLPKKSKGLTVFDSNGVPVKDEGDFLRSVANDLSLNVRINKKCIPDIFVNSSIKNDDENRLKLNAAYNNSTSLANQNSTLLNPVTVSNYRYETLSTPPVLILGYIIDKYRATTAGFQKENTFYIESPNLTEMVDRQVRYGTTYMYSVRTIASYTVISKNLQTNLSENITIYVSSNAVTSAVECYEYRPPPPPENVSARFDYSKNKPIIIWDMPVNPQRDVKQFQVFRRKNIDQNFQLIAQYGWDKSLTPDGEQKYTTGETVDCNNFKNMDPFYRHLAHVVEYPIYFHLDNDFVLDTDFYSDVSYIYSIASIDAHGMISNYSSQIEVKFIPYKNTLEITTVAQPGAPRQYPNMTLNVDTFKDAMMLDSEDTMLEIYLTPEYTTLTGNNNETIKVFEAAKSRNDADVVKDSKYYYLQLINLDNQKMNEIKINIYDPAAAQFDLLYSAPSDTPNWLSPNSVSSDGYIRGY